MGFGWQELLIILVIVGLIFGTSKLRNMGSDLGGAVKGFKKSLNEDEPQLKKKLIKKKKIKIVSNWFLEILIILILGLFIIGPKRLPVVVKNVLKFYRRMQNKFRSFKRDFEQEIGAEEINKDVFNELKMEELKEKDKSNND